MTYYVVTRTVCGAITQKERYSLGGCLREISGYDIFCDSVHEFLQRALRPGGVQYDRDCYIHVEKVEEREDKPTTKYATFHRTLAHDFTKDAIFQAGYHDAKNGIPYCKGENDFPYAPDAYRYGNGYLKFVFEREGE